MAEREAKQTLTVIRKPGRPRKPLPGPDPGNIVGTAKAGSLTNTERNRGVVASQVVPPVVPRLLDLHETARYLSVSEWTVRGLEHAGTLKRTRIPRPQQRELRKILFDRYDLDYLIEEWKE